MKSELSLEWMTTIHMWMNRLWLRIRIQLSIFKQKKNNNDNRKQKIWWTIQYNWIMHVPDSRSDCSLSQSLCVFQFAFIRRVSPVTCEIRFSETRQQNMMSYEIQCTVDYSVFIRNFSYRFFRPFYLLLSSWFCIAHQTVSMHYLLQCRMLHCLWRLTLRVRQKIKSKYEKNGFFRKTEWALSLSLLNRIDSCNNETNEHEKHVLKNSWSYFESFFVTLQLTRSNFHNRSFWMIFQLNNGIRFSSHLILNDWRFEIVFASVRFNNQKSSNVRHIYLCGNYSIQFGWNWFELTSEMVSFRRFLFITI